MMRVILSMFAPETEYERQGDVQGVVFPCGYTVAADGDTIHLYLRRRRFEYCFGARQHSLSLELAGCQRTLATQWRSPSQVIPKLDC